MAARSEISNPAWPRYLALCGAALPAMLFVISSGWSFPPFSPRQIIDSNDLFPFLVAPWAEPNNIFGLISRLVQVALLWRAPSFGISELVFGYLFWILVALARTLVGFILTRSVGWAFPRLFSHYAMYETSRGYGPVLVGYLLGLDGADVAKISGLHIHPQYFVIGLSLLMCWLDVEPWTYGIATLGVGTFVLVHSIFSRIRPLKRDQVVSGSPQRIVIPKMALTLVALITFTNMLSPRLSPAKQVSMPESPFPPARLLDIIILSFPRPDVQAAQMIIKTTLESYTPLLSAGVGLAVFTHVEQHPAFDAVQDAIGTSQNIAFYKDTDTHSDARSGQYLHLAEAFRWQLERGAEQAEWVMIVEDDFPLCGQEAGRNALRTVMKLLEDGREGKESIPARRGAFIGTGGSGLIFHRSLLPIMAHILRTHADLVSKLPPNMPSRPADVVMQDCLLGRDPLCPPKRPGGLIITSRLVMDHVGGMFSTNAHKATNSDKWRCGWRHAFHGMGEVDVVVVEDLW